MSFLRRPFVFGGSLSRLFEANSRHASEGAHPSLEDNLMALAIEESMLAMGKSTPNPAVGCIVWREGRVIARGHTGIPGQAHAERMAFDRLGQVWPDGATVAVTLEPCAHFGRTPPCLELFRGAAPLEIVLGCPDPNPAVSGQSIRQLRAWGHRVKVGVLQKEVGMTLLPFFKNQISQDVFVGLKWAQSLDGQLADSDSRSKWLTGRDVRVYTHWLRQRYDAIAVGLGTFILDKPALTVRDCPLPCEPVHPKKFVLDFSGRLHNMTQSDLEKMRDCLGHDPETWTFVSPGSEDEQRSLLGAHWWTIAVTQQRDFVARFLRHLSGGLRGLQSGSAISSLMVEGGAQTLSHFWESETFDFVHNWIAGVILGPGKHALRTGFVESTQSLTHAERLNLVQSISCGDDLINEWAPKRTIDILSRVSAIHED